MRMYIATVRRLLINSTKVQYCNVHDHYKECMGREAGSYKLCSFGSYIDEAAPAAQADQLTIL